MPNKDKRTVLFDTSALRGIGRSRTDYFSRTRKITVSPISIVELLLHLDEHQSYASIKKCHAMEIRSSPISEAATTRGGLAPVTIWWTLQPEITRKVVRICCSSGSIDDFLARKFTHDGHEYTINRYIEFARLQQSSLAQTYHTAVKNITDEIGAIKLDPEKMQRFSVGMAKEFAANHGLSPVDALSSFHFFSVYALAKAEYLLKNPNAKTTNDADDAYISLHANLTKDLVFVVNDKKFADLLRKGIEAITRTLGVPLSRSPLLIQSSTEFITDNLK